MASKDIRGILWGKFRYRVYTYFGFFYQEYTRDRPTTGQWEFYGESVLPLDAVEVPVLRVLLLRGPWQ